MAIRKSQVRKIKAAQADLRHWQDARASNDEELQRQRKERARANAVYEALLRNSSDEEWRAAD